MSNPNEMPPEIKELIEVLLNGEAAEVLEVTEDLMDEILRNVNDDLAQRMSKQFGDRIKFERTVNNNGAIASVTMHGMSMPFIATEEQLNAFLVGMASAVRLMKEREA